MFTACQASLLTSIFCHTQSDSKSILRGDLALVLISEGGLHFLTFCNHGQSSHSKIVRVLQNQQTSSQSTQPIKVSQYALDSANCASYIWPKRHWLSSKSPTTLTQSCQQACQQQGERTCLEYHETSFPTYVKVLLQYCVFSQGIKLGPHVVLVGAILI